MSPEQCYNLFKSLSFHFLKENYSFFRSKGRTFTKLKNNHKDYWIYEKLGKLYSYDECLGLFLSKISRVPKIHCSFFLSETAKDEFNLWKQCCEEKYYILRLQCSAYEENHHKPLVNIFKENNIRELLYLYYNKKLTLESLCLIYSLFPLNSDDIVFLELKFSIEKYILFLSFESEKVKNVLSL